MTTASNNLKWQQPAMYGLNKRLGVITPGGQAGPN